MLNFLVKQLRQFHKELTCLQIWSCFTNQTFQEFAVSHNVCIMVYIFLFKWTETPSYSLKDYKLIRGFKYKYSVIGTLYLRIWRIIYVTKWRAWWLDAISLSRQYLRVQLNKHVASGSRIISPIASDCVKQ